MPRSRERSIPRARERTRHEILGLNTEDLLEMYSTMVLCRTLDERLWQLNRMGRAAIVASCQGHEGGHIGVAWATHRGHDQFFVYYRDLGVVLSLGVTPREVITGFLAKEGEVFSGARQFPLHGAIPAKKLYNLTNVVGTHIPHAVGAALARKMRREDVVTLTFFGDGASSQGDCHEAMNFAGVHRLPIVFICENNRYATSVPQRKQMAIEDISLRAQGYGFPGVTVDGTDTLGVYQVAREAVARARSGGGPTLVEIKTHRYLPHTSDDDDTRYRPREEIEEARKHDPLKEFRRYLTEQGVLTEKLDQEYHQRARQEVDEATDQVEGAPYPETDDFYLHVYHEGGA